MQKRVVDSTKLSKKRCRRDAVSSGPLIAQHIVRFDISRPQDGKDQILPFSLNAKRGSGIPGRAKNCGHQGFANGQSPRKPNRQMRFLPTVKW